MSTTLPASAAVTPAASPTGPRPIEIALLASVFIVAACGLLYELAAGALASYVLGDSVLQFSTIIGTYLFAMGVGSWLSRYLENQLPAHFLRVELMVAAIGGLMPAALFLCQAYAPEAFRWLLYGMVGMVGCLSGLEIPLVMRILKRHATLKDLVSQVLTFDYLGALAISLAFPLILVPQLGLVRTGVLFGLLNALVATWAVWLFRYELRSFKSHLLACIAVMALLVSAWWGSDALSTHTEDRLYQDKIVLAHTSNWQRIAVTHGPRGHRLYLNGNLQFAQADEYRYHESLVHPAMSAFGHPRRVAVLGGGDGMAVREILRYPSVEHITLVELDPAMTTLFRQDPRLRELNRNALHAPQVHIENQDAFQWLQNDEAPYDVIVVDFPDPTNFAIGKLYTQSFYALLGRRLSASGYAVIQTTSPLVARRSFWIIVQTIEAAGLRTTPYHAHVPSFGEWGFVIASHRPWRMPQTLPADLRFLSATTLPLLFDFPLDMGRISTPVNRLSNQILVHTYEQEWGVFAP